MLQRPKEKLFATVSNQGTAMYETVLTETEYNNPDTRARQEKRAMNTPDAAKPVQWADVTENEAFWEDAPVDIKPLVEAAKTAWEAKGGQMDWIDTTAEVAEYFLGCVPPIYGPAGFGCGEAYTDNAKGEPVYLSFRKVDDNANTAQAKYCTAQEIREGLK